MTSRFRIAGNYFSIEVKALEERVFFFEKLSGRKGEMPNIDIKRFNFVLFVSMKCTAASAPTSATFAVE